MKSAADIYKTSIKHYTVHLFHEPRVILSSRADMTGTLINYLLNNCLDR